MRRHFAIAPLLATCLAWLCSSAGASGLQVAPVGLEISASTPARGLWLTNTGADTLHAQVRVFRWTQDKDHDTLTPSRALVVSPPMLTLAPGAQQLVRVIRPGPPPAGDRETAYRVVVDELPPSGPDRKAGVQYVLRYSIPVFVAAAAQGEARPVLDWKIHGGHDTLDIDIANHGRCHAQISQINFIDASGHKHPLKPGLLGYVLPGRHMHWALPLDHKRFTVGGTLEAKVNGETVTQTVSPGADAGAR